MLASRGSQAGTILEFWGPLRSLRDYLEANVPGAEFEHPGREGGPERGPVHSLLPGAGPRWLPETCSPPGRGAAPAARVGSRPPAHRPHGRAWRSRPATERNTRRGWSWQGRTREGRRGPAGAKRQARGRPPNSSHCFLPGARSGAPSPAASSPPAPLPPTPPSPPRAHPPAAASARRRLPRPSPPARASPRHLLQRGRGLGPGAQSATVPACPAPANESKASDSPPPR